MDEGLRASAEELTEPGRMWKSWAMIAAVLLTWVASACVQWGFNSARQQENDRRLSVLESAMDRKIDRMEYDARQQDIVNRLQRIENKLDRR